MAKRYRVVDLRVQRQTEDEVNLEGALLGIGQTLQGLRGAFAAMNNPGSTVSNHLPSAAVMYRNTEEVTPIKKPTPWLRRKK